MGRFFRSESKRRSGRHSRQSSDLSGTNGEIDLNGSNDEVSYNLKVGVQLVKRAVALENSHEYKEARDLYVQAADRLSQWRDVKNPADKHTKSVDDKINDYRVRATNLTLTHNLPDFVTVRGAAEFPVKYAGKFPTKYRTALRSRSKQMNALDQAKQDGHLLWNSVTLESSTLTVSVYGLKLTDQHQGVVMRQPLHSIASYNCCEDDGVWYLFFTCGNPQDTTFSCEVCECTKPADAAEICALLQGHLDEAFKKAKPIPDAVEEIAETPDIDTLEVTLDEVERPGSAAVADDEKWSEHFSTFAAPVSPPISPLPTPSPEKPALPVRVKKGPPRPIMYDDDDGGEEGNQKKGDVFNDSADPGSPDLWAGSAMKGNTRIRLSSRPMETPDDDRRSTSPMSPSPAPAMAWPPQSPGVNTTEMVKLYMTELRVVLNHDELREFAILLKAYRQSMPLDEFCKKLSRLFGQSRMYMLPGMRSFVGISQQARFDDFVSKNLSKEQLARPAVSPTPRTTTPKNFSPSTPSFRKPPQPLPPSEPVVKHELPPAPPPPPSGSVPPPPPPPPPPSTGNDVDVASVSLQDGNYVKVSVKPEPLSVPAPPPPPPPPPPGPPPDFDESPSPPPPPPGPPPPAASPPTAPPEKTKDLSDGFNPTFMPPPKSNVVPMPPKKANMFKEQMSTRVQKGLGPSRKQVRPQSSRDRKYPPKIDIMAESKEAEQQAAAAAPAWEASPQVKEELKKNVVINKTMIHFGKPVDVGAPQKTAIQIAQERKREKKEAEEAARRAAEEAERTKFDHMPEWKKAMFKKKEEESKKAKIPDLALQERAKEIVKQFADLPPWQQERAIKKEKRRILLEEGVIVP